MRQIFLSICVGLLLVGQSFAGPKKTVSMKDFGDKWPLTVESGELERIGEFTVVFHHGNKTYAVNGNAKSRGYPPIDPIWKNDPNVPGTKINIGDLIKLGLELGK